MFKKAQTSREKQGIYVISTTRKSVTRETFFIVDYDLPQGSSRRRFYRHIQKYLQDNNIDSGSSWSTQSVVITDDEEFAEVVYAEASQVGRCHMYKAKRIR